MDTLSVLLIGVGLAMDAFAISISNGISAKGFNKAASILQGIYFGGFQFLMPVIGYVLGTSVKDYIEAVDHWIAFGLLAVIGINMIKETFDDEDEDEVGLTLTHKKLALQAIATSIDALAVGISFAMLGENIISAAAIIGVVTFFIAVAGGLAGKRLGKFFSKKAGIFGGLVLIGIGIKILIEHTLL